MLCVRSLSDASGSRAGDGTEGKVGAFLHFTVFQTAAVSSAMFLTANHPNPLSAKFAEAATGQVRSSFSMDLMSCDCDTCNFPYDRSDCGPKNFTYESY